MITGPFDRPVIKAPNPLPSDIDWRMVESVLGVEIVQGLPSDSVEAALVRDLARRSRRSTEALDSVNLVDAFDQAIKNDEESRRRHLKQSDPVRKHKAIVAELPRIVHAIDRLTDVVQLLAESLQVAHGSLHSSVVGRSEGKPPSDSLSGESDGGTR